MVLYYTILYYTILYHTIPYHTIPYYNMLYYAMLYYTILYYAMICYTIRRDVAEDARADESSIQVRLEVAGIGEMIDIQAL